MIEASYRRFLLALLDAHLQQMHPFLFGASGPLRLGLRRSTRQLTQLALFDPTPAAVTLAEAPRVVAWTELMEDLSGLEVSDSDWITRDAFPQTLRDLLAETGRVYAPFLLANAAALASGAEQVECTIDGRPWVQQPFPYQGKCLQWLREQRAALGPDDRAFVDDVLSGTGCEVLFAPS